MARNTNIQVEELEEVSPEEIQAVLTQVRSRPAATLQGPEAVNPNVLPSYDNPMGIVLGASDEQENPLVQLLNTILGRTKPKPGQRTTGGSLPKPRYTIAPSPSPSPINIPGVAKAQAAGPSTGSPYQDFIVSTTGGKKANRPTPPADLASAIAKASSATGVPAELLEAISHTETGFRNIPQTGGGYGRGYFQIDLGQHPNVTEAQAMNPEFAAKYAADLLASNLKRAKGDPEVAIRAYNAGFKNQNNPITNAHFTRLVNYLVGQ